MNKKSKLLLIGTCALMAVGAGATFLSSKNELFVGADPVTYQTVFDAHTNAYPTSTTATAEEKMSSHDSACWFKTNTGAEHPFTWSTTPSFIEGGWLHIDKAGQVMFMDDTVYHRFNGITRVELTVFSAYTAPANASRTTKINVAGKEEGLSSMAKDEKVVFDYSDEPRSGAITITCHALGSAIDIKSLIIEYTCIAE